MSEQKEILHAVIHVGGGITLGEVRDPQFQTLLEAQSETLFEADLLKAAEELFGQYVVAFRPNEAGDIEVISNRSYHATQDEGEWWAWESHVSMAEAAEMLGITRAAVQIAFQKKAFRGVKQGKRWMLVREDVAKFKKGSPLKPVAAGRGRKKKAQSNTAE